jgi:hypothetical protein
MRFKKPVYSVKYPESVGIEVFFLFDHAGFVQTTYVSDSAMYRKISRQLCRYIKSGDCVASCSVRFPSFNVFSLLQINERKTNPHH